MRSAKSVTRILSSTFPQKLGNFASRLSRGERILWLAVWLIRMMNGCSRVL